MGSPAFHLLAFLSWGSHFTSLYFRFLSLNKHWTHRDNMRIKWGSGCKLLRTVPKRIVFTSAQQILRKGKKREKKSGDDVTKIRVHLWGISPYCLRPLTLFFVKIWRVNLGKYSSVLESYFVDEISNTEKWLMNVKNKPCHFREHRYM